MDAQGNEDRDVFGNTRKDAWGNPDPANVYGEREKDAWGNPLPDRTRQSPNEQGGLLENLWNKLFG